MGSCAAPSAKGDDKFITTDYLQQCRNEDVFKMLRSSAAILHGINNLRNNYSMAHPTETLLNEADARFAINLVRSIMTYVDELL
ncbi:abortive infection family protein [Escherichia coli]|uniref:abortive infection family protein n=1 Tax=Escherichia coli TaxID=562 RepID=UPI0021BEFE38|nr:abortive infection family protein [Escherichia coli]MCT9796770.1 abortive infection family protein [Escherichia coli]